MSLHSTNLGWIKPPLTSHKRFTTYLLYLGLSSFMTTALLSCTTLSPESHYNLAVDYAQQGRLAKAEQEYKRAIKAKPDLVQAHNNLGVLYLKQGRLAEAEREFQSVLSIKRDHLLALENLASTYDAMGGKDQAALETWKIAFNLETRSDIKT